MSQNEKSSPLELGKRIERLRKHFRHSQKDFAALLGHSVPSTVSQWETGRNYPSDDTLDLIIENFSVSRDWLLYGVGEMLPPPHATYASVAGQISSGYVPKQFKSGGGLFKNPAQSYLKILPIVVDNSNTEICPVVPVKAHASYTTSFDDVNFVARLEYETTPIDLMNKGSIRKFEVSGDSMLPRIMNGDFVYASYVEFFSERDLRQSIVHNRIYVVNTTQGLYIKRIEMQENEPLLRLKSDNNTVKTIVLPLDRLRELWYVHRIYSGQMPSPEDVQDKREVEQLTKIVHDLANTVSGVKNVLGTLAEQVKELALRKK